MIKTIIRAMYSAFISIVLISIILSGWTCFAFISQPTKSGEIINLIQDMYEGQKSVIINVALDAVEIDLSLKESDSSEIVQAPSQMTEMQMNDLFGEDPYLVGQSKRQMKQQELSQ